MKETKETNYKSYPHPIIRRKKSRLPSPLLLLILIFILLVLLLIFSPICDTMMHRDLVFTKNDAKLSPQTIMWIATLETTSTPGPAPSSAPLPILVNAQNPIPDDYDLSGLIRLNNIKTDLFTVKEENTMIDSICLPPLMEMLSAAHADGLTAWQISEGYRSVEAQQEIWNEKYEKYRTVNELSEEKAFLAVSKRVAVPGCSEHHTGLALDMTVPGEAFRLTPQAEWLKDHCHEYGFIIRYTEEKEYLTGITAEPWHIRYVGKDVSTLMYDKNWCLEEYIRKMNK